MEAERQLPAVAILLLNWNGWRDTIECLESLFRLDYPRLTVVLCDNASTDGSLARIRAWANGSEVHELGTVASLRSLVQPPVAKPVEMFEYSRAASEKHAAPLVDRTLVIIDNEANLGFAGGNNVGLRFLARQQEVKYVWVLNNDIVVAADSLRELVKVAEETPNLGGVGGTLMDYSQPGKIQEAAGGRFRSWQGLSVPLTRVTSRRTGPGTREPILDYLSGGCLLAPIGMLHRVGFFGESYFMYGEDVDFSFRMRQAGLRFAFAPRARVWHKGGASIGYRGARHDYYIVRNSLYLARKYHPRMYPVAAAYIAYRCVLPKLLRGQWQRLGVLRRAYRDFREGRLGPAPSLPGEGGP